MPAPEKRENLTTTQEWIEYLHSVFPVDSVEESLITIDFAHHEVHEGNFYTYSDARQINAGTINAVGIVIRPATGKRMHFNGFVSAGNSGYAELRENPSYTGGSTITPFNNDRNSANLSSGTIILQPTITVQGTLLQKRFIGTSFPSAKFGGESRTQNEWILNPSWEYLVRFVATNASTDVSLDIEYYEIDAV